MWNGMLRACLGATVVLTLTTGLADAKDKLTEVKERGQLRCAAHNSSHPGFAEITSNGGWKGFDIDFCRAVATAIFGTDDKHLELVPVSWAQRWPLLQSGEIDVSMKQSDWTESRDTELGLNFTRPYIIGVYQVMTRKKNGVSKISDLDGGTICTVSGAFNERMLASYLKAHKLKIEVVTYDKWEEMTTAYVENRCDGLMLSAPPLAVTRANSSKPDDHVILDDVVAISGQSWAVKQGDDQWFKMMNWILSALWLAEQEGITSANVDQFKATPPTPPVERLLGVSPGGGKRLGLQDDWAYNMIKRYGNYGEIWERNLGQGSPFKLKRGLNGLWNAGGVHFPLAFD